MLLLLSAVFSVSSARDICEGYTLISAARQVERDGRKEADQHATDLRTCQQPLSQRRLLGWRPHYHPP